MAETEPTKAKDVNIDECGKETIHYREDSIVADTLQYPPEESSVNNSEMVSFDKSRPDSDTEGHLCPDNSTDMLHKDIPMITITPADHEPEHLDISFEVSSEKELDIDSDLLGDQSSNKSMSINLNNLQLPTVDTSVNVSLPNGEDNLNVSRLLDSSNDVSTEVICRYSSTPVLCTPKSERNMVDSDVSMLSINSASPIVPTELHTPDVNHCQQDTSDLSSCGGSKSFPAADSVKYSDDLFQDSQSVPQHAVEIVTPDRAPCGPTNLPQPTYGDVGSRGERLGCVFHSPVLNSSYSSGNSSYFSCMQPSSGCDYGLGRENSWTDLSFHRNMSPLPPPSNGGLNDPCCFALGTNTSGCFGGVPNDAEYFVYPSIYVSSAGLISVLLRNDISVEMTVDRTIRVVSHNHMMAVATDSRGTAASLYHPAVKVYQAGTTTDIATHHFRAQMGGNDTILFSNGVNYFKLEGAELQPITPMKFIDILRDQSVNLLFSSEGYGEPLVASCMQVAAQAEYSNLPKGGVIVRINGVKVTQTGSGDVTVVTGAKFIRLSPNNGTTRLGNRFVDMEVDKDWSVKLTRGSHSFALAKKRAMVCNGKMEAGFDENNALKVTNLAPRHPLLAEPTMVRRPARKLPLRPTPVAQAVQRSGFNSNCLPPKRRSVWQHTGFGGGGRGGGGNGVGTA